MARLKILADYKEFTQKTVTISEGLCEKKLFGVQRLYLRRQDDEGI
jgi:hypothetical protein